MKELICYEVARCPEAGANLQVNEKNSFTHPSSCILPSFSQNTSELLLPKRLWKFESTISFWKCKWKVVLLVIYLFNYDSSKSIFFMLNYGITFSWGFSWVQFLSNKLEFFVSCNNIKIARTSILLCVLHVLFFKKVIVLYHGDYNFLSWHLCQFHTFNNNLNDEEMITSHLICAMKYINGNGEILA